MSLVPLCLFVSSYQTDVYLRDTYFKYTQKIAALAPGEAACITTDKWGGRRSHEKNLKP